MKPKSRGGDYSEAIRRVCADMTLRLPEFSHIRLERVGFSFCRTRNRERFGVWASMTPLRFEAGATQIVKEQVRWRIPEVRLRKKDEPLLYIFSVYVPRFIDLPLLEKIETIAHELYHISEAFDGDIRRFLGRHYAHGSKAAYDLTAARLARRWLAADPAPELWDFLRYDFSALQQRWGRIVGRKIAVPKPVRVEE